MNYKEFEQIIIGYMQAKGWTLSIAVDGSERLALEKNYNPNFTNKSKDKFLINDDEFYDRLKKGLDKLNITYKNFNSIDNPYTDTDFIVAGLQTINPIIYGSSEVQLDKWISFQPVIRLIEKDKCGVEEGYFSSFVNVCEISTNTNYADYIQDIENWIDILSICSLHSSGLQLILKPTTTAYNGVGLEFNYKGLELGQANLYNFNINEQNVMMSDFGFGYERILWAINGGKNFFAPFVSKYDYLFGDLKEVDRIRTLTLMAMSGIKGGSSGKSKHMRNLVKEAFGINIIPNINEQIKQYYEFYSKFISSLIELNEVNGIINNEVALNIKKKILKQAGISNYSSLSSADIETVCKTIFLDKVHKENKFTKIKEIKGGKRK